MAGPDAGLEASMLGTAAAQLDRSVADNPFTGQTAAADRAEATGLGMNGVHYLSSSCISTSAMRPLASFSGM